MDQALTEIFEEAFKGLNERQQEAVENYEGSMMVVAGPGTGKTQLLAIRIGYILQHTDAQAENILALTYTDAGAIAMRQRLLQFIGPAAYRVHIYTFHAFCNKVIKENAEYFGGYRNLQSISDLEQSQLLHDLIDTFDYDHPLKRLSGEIYFDRSRLINLFNTMKQEGWTAEDIEEAYATHMEEFMASDEVIYKRKYKEFNKGDININKVKAEEKKYRGVLAGSKEFNKYNRLLIENERFDYNDMILWVIKAFREHEMLLMDYQEKYHYFLVDEYQDTNGAQNELLFLLASYWEKPNIFAVGDDDQSIYRFQGANMGNLMEFQKRFDPRIVVLEENYRSTQTILNTSRKSIDNNLDRLVHLMGLSKNLRKARNDNPPEIDAKIIRYFNTVHEDKDIADRLIDLHKQGYDLSKVAVIYRKHKNIEDLVKYLNYKNIPIQLRREINVLTTVEITRILNILTYFCQEANQIHSGQELLFQILHYEYFGLRAADIGKIALHCSNYEHFDQKDREWRTVIGNEQILKKIEVNDVAGFQRVSGVIENLIEAKFNTTPQVFMEQLLTSTSILASIMKSDESTWRLQLVNSFFNLIKDESQKNPNASIEDLLYLIDIMNQSNISLNLVKIMHAENGVNFTTIHSSKGLEFDIVFLIKNDKANWAPRRNQGFSFPPTLVPAAAEGSVEDDRRLFYVAMTRARNELFITYSGSNEEGKPQEASEFVIELESATEKHTEISLPDASILEFKSLLMQFSQGKAELLDEALIQRKLQNFSLSATGLNKYLACPLSFYFENILRVPGSRNKWNGFGNAMHAALEDYFMILKNNPTELPSKQVLVDFYEKDIKRFRSHFTEREYEDYIVYGKQNLENYYDEHASKWLGADNYELELKIKDIEHKGVPINGMIDRLMEYPHGIVVYDYKTGRYRSEKLKPPLADDDLGGDYWRQIVFYSLLIKEYPYKDWHFMKGVLSFLEPHNEKLVEKEFNVEAFEQEIVSDQILHSYKGIMEHDFHGCGEEECKWCNFVQNNFTLSTLTEEEYEEN